MKKYLVVGAGFSGAVLANTLARELDCKVIVLDERNHIAGNCHTEREVETGVMVHKYGPHIFHTSNKEVWDYVNSFVKFIPFINRVKAVYQKQVYSLPINLHTINQFFGLSLDPKEAREFIEKKGDVSIEEAKTFEEQAKKFVGEELYRAFFYGYTRKQWGCEPKELPASILKRLPVRFNYDDNYYNDVYQGIPEEGYTAIVEKMLNHSNIEVHLNTKFSPDNEKYKDYDHVFYTGPVDAFFKYKHGKLRYRTVYFKRYEALGDYQGNAVINYADETIPYTRVHEHKHFTPWETHEKTVYFEEYSKATEENDTPYYPIRLKEDMDKYELYEKEVYALKDFTFLGRLATYRYMDMHHVIDEALQIAKEFVRKCL
ncbi:MAG: UDP-galactopyranose mutase [Leptospiraceae bacterium]|nr:UDP-galactopyranose mutase [Leptospiraceae bacterium]MCP5498260.1 UDP-galactopyranose mutase [Leptospiraceae bacterium]